VWRRLAGWSQNRQAGHPGQWQSRVAFLGLIVEYIRYRIPEAQARFFAAVRPYVDSIERRHYEVKTAGPK
jgi:hypothetical protein